MKTRVLYCESSADGTIGGSHHCLLHLVEHLDRVKFEPIVVFYEPHALLPRFQAAAETIVHPADSPVRWGNARGLMTFFGRGINLTKFLGTVRGHVQFLRRHRIGLVHLNNSITRHQDWMLAARLTRIPYIVHERGLNAVYGRRDRACARQAALIVPMSLWIRDHMLQRGIPGDNIRVMYDGLDPARVAAATDSDTIRQRFGIGRDQRVVGIVGNVRAWKGQETVIRALIDVARHFPDIVCLIVGAATSEDQSYLAGLEALVASTGLESNVRFTGYQKDVPGFIRAMEFVIHASIAPEPFGMVVLEAMAQRKAVIGSRAGGPTEMIVEGETGFTFSPGDAHELAGRMTALLADTDRTHRMGEAGHARLLREFTMEHYMRDLHAAYTAILGRQPMPDSVGLSGRGDRQAFDVG